MSLHYHPHVRSQSMSLDLLETCCLIYVETRQYPLLLNSRVSLLAACNNMPKSKKASLLLQKMKQWQKGSIREVRLFAVICEKCFRRGKHLKLLPSRLGFFPSLQSIRISWYLEIPFWGKRIHDRYWITHPRKGKSVGSQVLNNFTALETIIINFSMLQGHPVRFAGYTTEAKAWKFHVGLKRFLEFDGPLPDDSSMADTFSGLRNPAFQPQHRLMTETCRWTLKKKNSG
jgi:hypothetical protein